MAENYNIKWTNHAPETILALNRLRCQEALSDVVILCHAEVFRAHKLILSVCSEYFEEVFTSNPLADAREPVMVMHQTHPRLFGMVLDFMYTGEVEIPHCDLAPFMELAECLLIRGLRSYQHAAYEQPGSPVPGTTSDAVGEPDAVLQLSQSALATPTSVAAAAAAVAGASDDVLPPSTPLMDGPAGAAAAAAAVLADMPTPPDSLTPTKASGGGSGPPRRSGGGHRRLSGGNRKRSTRTGDDGSSARPGGETKSKRSRRQRAKTDGPQDLKPLSGNIVRDESLAQDVGDVAESEHVDENGEAHPPDSDHPLALGSVDEAAQDPEPITPVMEAISSLIFKETSKSGGPLYGCSACGYRTVSRSYALTHERTHTGERPFPCRLNCGKYFTQTSSRNLHESKRRCIPEDPAPGVTQGDEMVLAAD